MFRFLRQLFCFHRHTVRRTGQRDSIVPGVPSEERGTWLFTECLDCGKESPGVLTGWFEFDPTPAPRHGGTWVKPAWKGGM